MFGYKLTRQGRAVFGFGVYIIILFIVIPLNQSIWPLFLFNGVLSAIWLIILLVADDVDDIGDFLENCSWYVDTFIFLFAGLITGYMICRDILKACLPILVIHDVRKKKRKNEEILAERDDKKTQYWNELAHLEKGRHFYEDDLTEDFYNTVSGSGG